MTDELPSPCLACPRCSSPLRTWAKTPAELCSGCGGVWFARTREESLLDELDMRARIDITEQTRVAPNVAGTEPEVRCPVCAASMARAATRRGAMMGLPRRRIELDVCADHGIWLDRGELADLAGRLLEEREPSVGVVARGLGGGPDAGDVVGFLMRLLARLCD